MAASECMEMITPRFGGRPRWCVTVFAARAVIPGASTTGSSQGEADLFVEYAE